MALRMLALCLSVAAAIAAGAARAEPARTPPDDGGATATPDKDPIVCRTLPPPTGSRLGQRRICQKQSVWDQLQKDSQDAVNKTQKNGDLARTPGS